MWRDKALRAPSLSRHSKIKRKNGEPVTLHNLQLFPTGNN